MSVDRQYIENNYTLIPLAEQPAIILWAADIDYKLDTTHVIWLDSHGDGNPIIHYGYLDEDFERVSLASYDENTLTVSREANNVYPMRMITTLRWLWKCCLFTDEPVKRYRWYRLPEQLEEAYSLHERIYGSRRTSNYIYGSSTKNAKADQCSEPTSRKRQRKEDRKDS